MGWSIVSGKGIYFYVPSDWKNTWEKFKKMCKSEGFSHSERIRLLIDQDLQGTIPVSVQQTLISQNGPIIDIVQDEIHKLLDVYQPRIKNGYPHPTRKELFKWIMHIKDGHKRKEIVDEVIKALHIEGDPWQI